MTELPQAAELNQGRSPVTAPLPVLKFNLPTMPTNIIFTGVAGTGKTYYLRQLQQLYDERLETTSIEQLACQQLEQHSWREVLCAALLSEDRSMSVPELMRHPLIRAKMSANARTDNVSQTLWGQLNLHAHPESETVTAPQRAAHYYFDKTSDNSWYLLEEVKPELHRALAAIVALIPTLMKRPSPTAANKDTAIGAVSHDSLGLDQVSGASSMNSAGFSPAHLSSATPVISRSVMVSFHQAYGYEEFVEGIRPIVGAQGQISYQIQPGAFLKLCQRAAQDPEHRYAILIDEINRANVSRVFGELMTLIEPDKRAGQLGSLQVALAYSGRSFSVPSNVDIYATMNTQDHSLAALDLAFRRRFRFIDCPPLPHLLPVINSAIDTVMASEDSRKESLAVPSSKTPIPADLIEYQIDLARLLIGINSRLCQILGQDSQIGHAFLMSVTELTELQTVIIEQIIPQLAQLTGQQVSMMQFILNDNEQPIERQFIHDKPLPALGSPLSAKHNLDARHSFEAIDPISAQFNHSLISPSDYAHQYSMGSSAADQMLPSHSGFWINPDLLRRCGVFATAAVYHQLY